MRQLGDSFSLNCSLSGAFLVLEYLAAVVAYIILVVAFLLAGSCNSIDLLHVVDMRNCYLAGSKDSVVLSGSSCDGSGALCNSSDLAVSINSSYLLIGGGIYYLLVGSVLGLNNSCKINCIAGLFKCVVSRIDLNTLYGNYNRDLCRNEIECYIFACIVEEVTRIGRSKSELILAGLDILSSSYLDLCNSAVVVIIAVDSVAPQDVERICCRRTCAYALLSGSSIAEIVQNLFLPRSTCKACDLECIAVISEIHSPSYETGVVLEIDRDSSALACFDSSSRGNCSDRGCAVSCCGHYHHTGSSHCDSSTQCSDLLCFFHYFSHSFR